MGELQFFLWKKIFLHMDNVFYSIVELLLCSNDESVFFVCVWSKARLVFC